LNVGILLPEHRNLLTMVRVSPGAGLALLDREHSKAARLDPLATRKCGREHAQDGIDDGLDDGLNVPCWYKCGFCSASLAISSDLIVGAPGCTISPDLLTNPLPNPDRMREATTRDAPGFTLPGWW
jgi:hypothetical protein